MEVHRLTSEQVRANLVQLARISHAAQELATSPHRSDIGAWEDGHGIVFTSRETTAAYFYGNVSAILENLITTYGADMSCILHTYGEFASYSAMLLDLGFTRLLGMKDGTLQLGYRPPSTTQPS